MTYATQVIRDLLASTKPTGEITNEFRIKVTHWEGQSTHYLSITRKQAQQIARLLNLLNTNPEE